MVTTELRIDPQDTSLDVMSVDRENAHEIGNAHDLREVHPLQPLLPLLAQSLAHIADESAHMMVVTDADGRVLWRDGNPGVLRDGNPGVLRVATEPDRTESCTDRPLRRILHVRSRSAAPIIDPDTDRVLGCVDISGTARSPHPATVALVCATAKLAETQLALRMHERDERLRRRYEALGGHSGILLSPTGRVLSGDPLGTLGERLPLPAPGERMILRDGRFVLLEPFSEGYLLRAAPPASAPAPVPTRLRLHGFLGEGSPTALVGEHRLPLSLRHAEILALLALHPGGLNAEQLSFHLYGDDGNPVTIRVEIHRLRAELGDTIGARPYRLTSPIEADFLELRGLLASSDPASLARVYAGPLLPRSESPEIRRERDEFEVQVRTCLLLRGSPDDLWAYAQTSGGREDFEILQRLATTLPATDHRAAAAQARLRA
ncbi:helix-turn-helix domain-containing protein [Nonomuraea sp. NPDC050022]|uniref:helix-turn-helix domain-containing protein n=1 Tax=unclassified Nonomuraea TaxID=2593643 RepID=UPI0033C84A82